MTAPSITTLGALKQSAYVSKSIKEELRDNLIKKISEGKQLFPNIHGFESTVIPQIKRAILSQHNILLLGLRGQAKTRISRSLIDLLDDYIPVVKGCPINDDPLNPIGRFAKDLILDKGDETPIEWLSKSNRYVEKLATPDVSISDLIGDVDPIKAATLKLPYSDERTIHFGLIPRANRCIFVLNELPDLQPRIQVSLFNILQEGDLQIRGFMLRMPINTQFMFTANPEDYTNRGSIITPLKDRIEAQIITHYISDLDLAKRITLQEVNLSEVQKEKVIIPDIIHEIIEEIAICGRVSEYIDANSGVSPRLTISAYEALVATAELRALESNVDKIEARIQDIWGVIPSITGKIELVYEGEVLGAAEVAEKLIGDAIQKVYNRYFPKPDEKSSFSQHFNTIIQWFKAGNLLELYNDQTNDEFLKNLQSVPKLDHVAIDQTKIKAPISVIMEFVLHGLTQHNVLHRNNINSKIEFSSFLAQMFDDEDFDQGYFQ